MIQQYSLSNFCSFRKTIKEKLYQMLVLHYSQRSFPISYRHKFYREQRFQLTNQVLYINLQLL